MAELYETAVATNLMLAPANSTASSSPVVSWRHGEILRTRGRHRSLPSFLLAGHESRQHGGPPWLDHALSPYTPSMESTPDWTARADAVSRGATRPNRAWEGTRIIEFGTGAAGPIAVRYFAEHGATVIRIESRSRPDFLRTYGQRPANPCGLDGSDMFDAVNVGKLGVTLNLKHPEGVGLARRLIEWADAVAENFAPRAMRGFGLDYPSLAPDHPDLVMVSSCLQGQTGPHKDYPGFGGQGSTLSGYNLLTGWPDREPVGPYGTITDSLAPRFVATALAAGLLHMRRTGAGSTSM